MKTEPTEALELKKSIQYGLGIIDAGSGILSELSSMVDDVVNIAFQEGQSNPKIKQLEWKEEGSGYTTLQSPFMSKYDVQYSELHNGFKPRIDYRDSSYWINSLIFDTAEEAKNFCQEDYERRVKECLE